MIQWVHFAFAALCIFASFSKNRLAWKKMLTADDIAQIRMFDKVSASAAGLLAVTGLAMLLWLAKPAMVYLSDSRFWFKMALFVVASALVIWTKVDFRRAANGTLPWTPPARVRVILAFDFVGLFVLAALGRLLAIQTYSLEVTWSVT